MNIYIYILIYIYICIYRYTYKKSCVSSFFLFFSVGQKMDKTQMFLLLVGHTMDKTPLNHQEKLINPHETTEHRLNSPT